MLASIPLIVWLVTAIAVRRTIFHTDRLDDLLRALLFAGVLVGTYLVLLSELLSLFGALTFGPLLFGWATPAAGLLWVVPRLRSATSIRRLRFDLAERLLLIAVAGIAAVTWIVALVSAPNTYDAMTFHLPRVMHWAQNASLAHYATNEPRQLFQGPGAELVTLHLQILSGSDRFAGLVQWGAMAGSLLAVALIAGELGAGKRGRVLSVLAAATIPMGLLQAVSTQTDYAVSLPVLAAVYFVLRLARRVTSAAVLGVGGSVGLAILVKPTAYFFLAPFLVWLTWRLLKARARSAWRPLLVIAAVFLMINGGHYSRNLELFGTPFNPTDLGEYHLYRTQALSAGILASNFIRNAALHLTLPAPGLVERSFAAIRRLHDILGLDPDDPDTTWPGLRFEPAPTLVHEDFSGNFLHALAVLAAATALVTSRRLRRRLPLLLPYLVLAACGALLFAALLKWMPWHSRLHLPVFLVAAPVLGAVFERLLKSAQPVIAAALLAQSIPFLCSNPLHPVIGEKSIFATSRGEQTFHARPGLGDLYRGVTSGVAESGCRELGLVLPPDSWEYPLWPMMNAPSPGLRLKCVGVENTSRRLEDPEFEAYAVFCLRCPPHQRQRWTSALGEPALVLPDDHHHQAEALLFLRR